MSIVNLNAILAVGVHKVISPEVSGSPLTGATDEMVINASGRLEEVLVQGSISSDQFLPASKD